MIKENVISREEMYSDDVTCHLCTLVIQPGENAVFTIVEAPGTQWHGAERVYHEDCWLGDEEGSE